MKYSIAALTLLSAALVNASPISTDAKNELDVIKRATDTVTVNLDQCSGSPQHYGSGILYGVQGTNTPPQSCKSDTKTF